MPNTKSKNGLSRTRCINGIGSWSEGPAEAGSTESLFSVMVGPQINYCLRQATETNDPRKSGVSRIYADQVETDQCKGQQNAEEQRRSVFETTTRCDLESVHDPIGGEIEDSADQREVDELHRDAQRATVRRAVP